MSLVLDSGGQPLGACGCSGGGSTHMPPMFFARNITESFNFLCVKRW